MYSQAIDEKKTEKLSKKIYVQTFLEFFNNFYISLQPYLISNEYKV